MHLDRASEKSRNNQIISRDCFNKKKGVVWGVRSLYPICPPKVTKLLTQKHRYRQTNMMKAASILALAASAQAFAPAPITKSSTALNDVWDN